MRTVDELLSIQEVELVVVATPNTTHAPLAVQCLEAGRHVVVDKPFAPSSAEAEAVSAAAARAGRILSVYHNRRWDGDFLTLQRLLAAGTCGHPVFFESRFDGRYRPHPKPGAWRERAAPGSGVLFDLGPHLVDQALVLFGQPGAVTADVRAERDGMTVDDAFDVTLHYSGMRVRLAATMLAADPGPRFVLRGTAGTFVKHGVDPQDARTGNLPGGASWGEEPEERWGELTRASASGTASERVRTLPGDYRAYRPECPRGDPRFGAPGGDARTGNERHSAAGSGGRQQSPGTNDHSRSNGRRLWRSALMKKGRPARRSEPPFLLASSPEPPAVSRKP